LRSLAEPDAALSSNSVRYTITVEPDPSEAYSGARPVRATIEADGKDEALDRAETAYRRLYPELRQLRSNVVRHRPHS
jgi:hypothetical protein